MELVTTIIIICTIFTIVSEFATHITYGSFLTDDEVFAYLKKYKSFSINPFEHSILSGDIDWSNTQEVMRKLIENDYISTTNMSLFSKYYISGKGRVFSWSKSAKEISILYKIAPIK